MQKILTRSELDFVACNQRMVVTHGSKTLWNLGNSRNTGSGCAALSRSVVSASATPWVVAHQAPLWGLSRPESWSVLPFPPPGDLPHPEIKPESPTLQADSLLSEPPGKPSILEWVAVSFFKRLFPTQGLKLVFLHCSQILYHLSLQGRPRILEQVAYPFSRGSSRPRKKGKKKNHWMERHINYETKG